MVKTQKITADYKSRLWKAIKSIELSSQAEAVVVFRACSGTYGEVPLSLGVITAWLCFTYLMYSPTYFENWLVYCLPMLIFGLCYAVGLLPAVKRLSVKRAILDKNVEIMARAIFQKGGIRHTRDKTGLMVYCSFLERRVLLLPDRGLELAVPQSVWRELEIDYNRIFAERSPEALLQVLAKTATVFATYLPVREGDLNELPDQLEIDI
ncbi:MAG: hypothetical protein ACU836_18665 [Gammaproteobacteria bacterium]